MASLLLVLNLCPRGMLVICLVAFLSFISTAQDFASYQSDGMLLEAGFISLFFAPAGWRPRWGFSDPPSRASRFLLVWLMFRIYFESGVAKILGHDPEWRNFTAMDQYYQNGPLPTWIAWYAQHLPHGFHVATAFLTLALELVLIFAVFLPRRSRIRAVLYHYALADRHHPDQQLRLLELSRPRAGLSAARRQISGAVAATGLARRYERRSFNRRLVSDSGTSLRLERRLSPLGAGLLPDVGVLCHFGAARFPCSCRRSPLPVLPVRALEPFRFANDFGLFAVMTRERYEIEFQGSRDGQTWTAYPFRYKPQDVHAPPRIYAPYQPRFDWNLWFASLGNWREYPFVLQVEQRLLTGEPDVLALFAGNPFPGEPPRTGPRGSLAILVLRLEGEARTGTLVAARVDWTLRADARARARRKNFHPGVAGDSPEPIS